jgi:hypothetical protein
MLNKFKQTKLSRYLIYSSVMMGYLGMADTIPYLGPRDLSASANCSNFRVNKPNEEYLSKIDGGVLLDENCKTIFVKPPIFGNAKINGRPFIYGGVSNPTCDTYNTEAELMSSVNNAFKLKFCSKKEQTFKSGQLTCSTAEKQMPSTQDLMDYNDSVEIMENLLNRYKKSDEIISRMSVVFSSEWQKLVDAYQVANSNVTVQALNISFAMPARVPNEEKSELEKFTNPDHYKLKIAAHEVNLSATNLPEDIKKMVGTGLVPFIADSFAAQVTLGVTTGCPIITELDVLSNSGTLVQKLESDAKATTFTYFYPVNTKSFATISVLTENIKPVIEEIINKQIEEGKSEAVYS